MEAYQLGCREEAGHCEDAKTDVAVLPPAPSDVERSFPFQSCQGGVVATLGVVWRGKVKIRRYSAVN